MVKFNSSAEFVYNTGRAHLIFFLLKYMLCGNVRMDSDERKPCLMHCMLDGRFYPAG
jgi:hypothetical protein